MKKYDVIKATEDLCKAQLLIAAASQLKNVEIDWSKVGGPLWVWAHREVSSDSVKELLSHTSGPPSTVSNSFHVCNVGVVKLGIHNDLIAQDVSLIATEAE